MKGTLVFVHGTGVRQEGWVTLFQRVKDYARMNGIEGVGFKGCGWGPKLGVPLNRIPDTLPPEVVLKGRPEAFSDAAMDAAAWALLLDDPLFELRVASEGAPAAPEGSIGGVVVDIIPTDQKAEALLLKLADTVGTLDLEGTGLQSKEIADAARIISKTSELHKTALVAGNVDDPDLIHTAARAVVAHALAAHRLDPSGTAPTALYDGKRRDELVGQLEKIMIPVITKGFTDWVKKKVVAFAQRKASRIMEDRRQGFMGASTPALGDILYYQRRGEEICRFITESLTGLPRPVVTVGHSLGGIMLVDILSRGKNTPPVDLLVTAGSQSPMLYAIDALEQLRPGKSLMPFTPWLNIYNRQDFLSFCATRIFPGIPGIRDEEVDPGVPFPESHSAYWYHDRVYELIRDAWPVYKTIS